MTYNKKGGQFCAWFGIYFLSLFLFVASHPSNSSAAIYRWVDSSGMVHVSDGLDNVPPTYRNNLKIVTEPYEVGKGIIIPFKRTASGLVLVNAVLNGNVKAELILDTGANLVVITEALSKKLNQDLSLGNEVIKLHTNCGEVEGRSFMINKMELGDARKENVKAVITSNDYPFSGADGLLGLSFLGDFKVTVDYQNEKIIINK
jgi:clan AA aspartic protease (TIGR02281 family)